MFQWLFKRRKEPAQIVLKQPAQAEIPSEPLPHYDDLQVHLGIVVGHTLEDGGALLNIPQGSMNEYQYGKQVATDIMRLAKKFPRLKVSVFLRDDGGIAGAYDRARGAGCDCVVELHFNSFNGKSTGTLTLTTPDPKDLAFSNIVHWYLCEAFGRKGASKGVLAIGRRVRGSGNVYAFPEGANCLVEPFFGDSEAELGLKKQEAYAEAILRAVQEWGVKQNLISVRRA